MSSILSALDILDHALNNDIMPTCDMLMLEVIDLIKYENMNKSEAISSLIHSYEKLLISKMPQQVPVSTLYP